MKLHKHLKKIAPLDSKSAINDLLDLMKERQEHIGCFQENLLLIYTVEDLHDYLLDCIKSYRRSYRSFPPMPIGKPLATNQIISTINQKPKTVNSRKDKPERIITINGISKNGLSEDDVRNFNMNSYRKNHEADSLSSRGYEYGLSDW